MAGLAAASGLCEDLGEVLCLTIERRAGEPLGSGARGRLTAAERTEADRYGWFTSALRGLSEPDPRVALLCALWPVGWVPDLFVALLYALRPVGWVPDPSWPLGPHGRRRPSEAARLTRSPLTLGATGKGRSHER
jgi:hypothetical protein